MVANGVRERPILDGSRNLPAINAIAVAIKNENTIATPPNLGMASLWRCRPLAGAESHPLRTETSRTNLVSTKESSREPANVPRNNNVNQFPLELCPLRTFIADEGGTATITQVPVGNYSLRGYCHHVSDLCTGGKWLASFRIRCARLQQKMRIISKFRNSQFCALGALITLAITGFAQTAVSIDQAAPAPSAAATVSTSTAAVAALGGDSAVRLGAGDLVEVSVYNVPELNTKLRVSTSGDIYLPLINNVHVAGLTLDEAQIIIERRLDRGGFVKNPHVQIFVAEYNSEGASILGEVAKPANYPILGDQKLFSLISSAGGLTDRAGKSATVTHRDRTPITVPISHNLEDHPESDITVLPGDIVTIRRADIVYVVGEVNRPSGFLMDSGHLSVLQAIALAGGTNSTAKLNGARIVRKGPSGLTIVPVQLKKLMEAKISDLPMQADDILFVPTSSRKLLQARTAEAAVQMATAAGIVAIRP
jgi:polysaccharide export outer membrane protein